MYSGLMSQFFIFLLIYKVSMDRSIEQCPHDQKAIEITFKKLAS